MTYEVGYAAALQDAVKTVKALEGPQLIYPAFSDECRVEYDVSLRRMLVVAAIEALGEKQ